MTGGLKALQKGLIDFVSNWAKLEVLAPTLYVKKD